MAPARGAVSGLSAALARGSVQRRGRAGVAHTDGTGPYGAGAGAAPSGSGSGAGAPGHAPAQAPLDPAANGITRLPREEYRYTVRSLLGVRSRAARGARWLLACGPDDARCFSEFVARFGRRALRGRSAPGPARASDRQASGERADLGHERRRRGDRHVRRGFRVRSPSSSAEPSYSSRLRSIQAAFSVTDGNGCTRRDRSDHESKRVRACGASPAHLRFEPGNSARAARMPRFRRYTARPHPGGEA